MLCTSTDTKMNVSQNVSDNPPHVSPELPAEIAEEKSAYLYVIAVLAAYVLSLIHI